MSHPKGWIFRTARDVQRCEVGGENEKKEESQVDKRGNKLLPVGAKVDSITSGSKTMASMTIPSPIYKISDGLCQGPSCCLRGHPRDYQLSPS